MTRVDPYLQAMGITALWQRREPLAVAPGVDNHATDRADHDTASIIVDPVPPAREPSAANAIPATPHHGDVLAAEGHDALASAAVAPESSVPPSPTMPSNNALAALDIDGLRERVLGCTACRLCETRTQAVFGVGDEQADWMFVGEGPGMNEDLQGEPFVGQAGKLLDNMLLALGLNRNKGVFIANVVKCRPPGNRDPQPDEVAMCEGYLKHQIALIKPKMIVALGRFAAHTLLRSEAKIGAMRGTVHAYEGVPVIVTYHPAYLLRTLSDKAKAWQDLCLARATFAAAPNRAERDDAQSPAAIASMSSDASGAHV